MMCSESTVEWDAGGCRLGLVCGHACGLLRLDGDVIRCGRGDLYRWCGRRWRPAQCRVSRSWANASWVVGSLRLTLTEGVDSSRSLAARGQRMRWSAVVASSLLVARDHLFFALLLRGFGRAVLPPFFHKLSGAAHVEQLSARAF